MADMAPALTGAAQEAPHRLKLSASSTAWKARSGLLLLNGGEKGRSVREDASGGRPDDAPGPGSVGAGEKPLCELELMEVPEGAAGPGRRVGDGPGWRVEGLPGHGKRPQGALGPGHRLEGALGPGKRPEGSTVMGQRVEAAPGPGRRTLGEGRRRPLRVQGSMEHLEGPLVPSPALNSALGPTTCPVPETTSRLDSALGPTTAREDLERRKDGPGEKKMDCVPGPATHTGPQGNAKGHLAGQHLVPEPMRRTEGISEQSALPDCAPGPLPVEPVVSQGCIPGSHAPQDFVPGSLAPQDSASMDSQDTSPGPRVLCALRAAQMSSRQQELGARARRLCRRLQVIQAKQVERHVRQQLSGLVEMLSERGAAGLPGSPHVELDRLACSSTARLRAAQGGFDSDATESSSGGETDEEEVAGTAAESPEHERVEEEQSRASGSNRHSEWRWAVERAAIICRWTWLQAQVSDLEFRIRQQTEIYKQIRCTKGSVVLGDSPHCEDSTTRQTASSSVVLNARGNRVPSSCSKTAPKAPSGNDPCDNLCNTPTPSPQSLDKQCSRLMQSVENVACQNPPTTPVCDSPGSQKTSRQVNGLINCVRSSASCNGSAEDLDPEEVLGKKRRVDTPSTSPALSDSTCVAARTRPLRSHKKRSLVRSSDVASLSRKPQKLLSTKCGCDPPTTCILCGCKTYAKTSHPSTMALNERIALMDPCYHPILSFPYDTPLHLHFEALLKEDRQFRVSNKLKILKLSQFIKKPHEAGSYLHARSEQERLVQYRLENWQKNTRLIYDGTGDRMKSQQQRTPPYPTHSGSMLRDDRQYKGVPSPSIHVSSPVTPRPNTAAHQLPSLNDTPPSASQNSSSAALKRKRFENSYDIDNIVIPMSLVAASRVEKLQYKEILTPSWRVLDSTEKDTMDMDPQLEDLSDEAYQERHSKYEELERSRWDSWTSTVPQRRGSRSSNKSDGRWTPQPPNSQGSSQQMASPDIRFHSLNDVPLSLSSAASDNPEPYSTVQCLSVHSRTRVLSWSEDTRSSTPEIPDDEEQTVQPWEPRSFPLLDRDCRTLQNLPGTPSRSRTKPHPDVSWQTPSKPGAWTESIDSGMSTENLTPASKESPIPNSISVVRVRAHSGDKIASLEYFPARSVNKR